MSGSSKTRRVASGMLAGMDQRISVITLGVRDLVGARSFYEALGWTGAVSPDDEIAFFQAGPMVLSLWRRELLAEESGVPDPGGFGGIVLGHVVRSPEEVDELIGRVEPAGGKVTRPAAKMVWGGYSATFCDPEGHPWEVAHNPSWTLAEDGAVSMS
jgi:predicted lactoylglutathione lyase